MQNRWITLSVLTLGVPLCALANAVGPCQAATVTSIQFSTCTIGDKTFQFADVSFALYAVTGQSSTFLSDVPTDDLIFAPDAGNPNSPGFVLSAEPGFNLSLTEGSSAIMLAFFLDGNTISVTDPSSGARIIGTTLKQTGAAVTQTDLGNDYLAAFADNSLFFPAPCSEVASVGLIIQNGTTLFNSPTESVDSPCAPAALVQSNLDFKVIAMNGTSSFTSAGYYWDEAAASGGPSVPEPSSVLLLAIATAAVLGWFNLRRSAVESMPHGRRRARPWCAIGSNAPNSIIAPSEMRTRVISQEEEKLVREY